jgi:SAM-dependent methyltransferase
MPSCWDDAARHVPSELFWLTDPLVRAAVNRRVTGDPDVWPIPWFAAQVRERLPFARALSVGCGTGALERALVREGVVERIVGVDAALVPLGQARRAAAAEGVGRRIAYVAGNAHNLLERPDAWDAVFFHGALHHFSDVAATLERVRRALKPDGLLYLDEYVGRSRADWRLRHLLWPNLVYRLLPRRVRRTRVVRPPFDDADPTEQVDSGSILPALASRFRILARRDYGGDLLLLVYGSLRRPGPGGPPREVVERAVRRLLRLEDRFLRRPPARRRSAHAVVWAEPLRREAEASPAAASGSPESRLPSERAAKIPARTTAP